MWCLHRVYLFHLARDCTISTFFPSPRSFTAKVTGASTPDKLSFNPLFASTTSGAVTLLSFNCAERCCWKVSFINLMALSVCHTSSFETYPCGMNSFPIIPISIKMLRIAASHYRLPVGAACGCLCRLPVGGRNTIKKALIAESLIIYIKTFIYKTIRLPTATKRLLMQLLIMILLL